MSRYAFNKRDTTHSEIVQAFREGGCAVQDLAPVGHGCPDLLVSLRGENHLVECKNETGKLQDGQIDWALKWNAPVFIVRSARVAELLVEQWREGLLSDVEKVG